MSLGARIYAELRGDRTIWMVLALLSIFSLMIVYSSTSAMAHARAEGDTESFLMRQLFFLGAGLFVTYLTYKLHYEKYKSFAPWLMLATIPLLFLTMTYGIELNGAKRWLRIPFIGLTFQTSELAKLALIIYVAREITRHKDYIKDFNKAFLPIIVPILMVCGLIAPADLSTSLLLLGVCLMMMFVGRVSVKFIFLLIFSWVLLFTTLVTLAQLDLFDELVRLNTWISRIREFGSGDIFQVEQAKIAIANGEIFGSGPGNSIQKNFLPSAYSDYVYATIFEEYGLIGGAVTLILYVLLFFRVASMVSKDPAKAFGMMVALGLALVLVGQALINMAVAVDLVPVTGLTLPILSRGGTSLIFTCASFGIILSVSKYVERAVALGRTGIPEIQQKDPAAGLKKADGGGLKGGGSGKSGGRNDGGSGRPPRDNNRGGSGGGGNRSGGSNRSGGNNRQSGGGNRNNTNRSGGSNRKGGGGGSKK